MCDRCLNIFDNHVWHQYYNRRLLKRNQSWHIISYSCDQIMVWLVLPFCYHLLFLNNVILLEFFIWNGNVFNNNSLNSKVYVHNACHFYRQGWLYWNILLPGYLACFYLEKIHLKSAHYFYVWKVQTGKTLQQKLASFW